MPTLHLVRQSAFATTDLQQCMDVTSSGDSIVFIDDGCYCLAHAMVADVIASTNVQQIMLYTIAEHANARAVSIPESVIAISMDDMVKLTFKVDNVITWQ